MPKVIRITNTFKLSSANPHDKTTRLSEATHQYFYFAEYEVDEDGTWREGHSLTAVVGVDRLAELLDDADLLQEIPTTKQSGGDDHD